MFVRAYQNVTTYIYRYLVIYKARQIIKKDGQQYRFFKSIIASRKKSRDLALDRWSRTNETDSNYLLFYAELIGCREEYYKAVSDLLCWRKKYKMLP